LCSCAVQFRGDIYDGWFVWTCSCQLRVVEKNLAAYVTRRAGSWCLPLASQVLVPRFCIRHCLTGGLKAVEFTRYIPIESSRWGRWASSSKANASRKSDPYSVQSNEGRVKEFHPTRAYASRPALLRPCPCGHINSSLQPLGTHERGSDGHAWRMPWFAEVCRPWILRCRCWITLESLLEAPNTRSPLAN
jgi:hypothetical protein